MYIYMKQVQEIHMHEQIVKLINAKFERRYRAYPVRKDLKLKEDIYMNKGKKNDCLKILLFCNFYAKSASIKNVQ